MIIQEYSTEDRGKIAEFILGIQNGEFGIPITLEQQPDLSAIPNYYQTGKGNFWVAKDSDAVIGTIALLDIGNGAGALRKMFVAKSHRGKELGIGQRLLNYLLAWAKGKGLQEIYLGTTEKFAAAQRFYEKNNFVEVLKHELPEKFPVMEVDVKFYKYSFY